MSDVRWDLIAHIREQIEAGSYETQGKLRIVSEKIAERLRERRTLPPGATVGPCPLPSISPPPQESSESET
jgi:hypothetical protein